MFTYEMGIKYMGPFDFGRNHSSTYSSEQGRMCALYYAYAIAGPNGYCVFKISSALFPQGFRL